MTEIDNTSMNFFDHLKELRQKLLYVIIFFLLTFVISFYFSQSIFEFLAKPLTSILGAVSYTHLTLPTTYGV